MNKKLKTILAVIVSALTLASCASENSSSAGETTTQTATAAAQTESTPAPEQNTNIKSEKGHAGYNKYTLSGNKSDTLTTTDFCYIESDKYFLLMEKDLALPGDFTVNLDKIIDGLEKSIGLKYDPDTYDYSRSTDVCTARYGFNPWEGLDFGRKIPIYLIVDREDVGLISNADETNAVICNYELFSDDLWNSVPSYRDNEFRRPDHIQYGTFAHELTHTITSRCVIMSKTLTEGSASYYSWKAVKALADTSEDMQKSLDDLDYEDVTLSVKITADNAEKVFVDDFADLETEDRGEEYTFGKYLWKYFDETYGTEKTAELFAKFKQNEVIGKAFQYGVDNKDTALYARIIKEHFGDDVFAKFGAQYPN